MGTDSDKKDRRVCNRKPSNVTSEEQNQRGKEKQCSRRKEALIFRRKTERAGREFQKGRKHVGTGQEKHRLTDNRNRDRKHLD